jgi:hypothetical protein
MEFRFQVIAGLAFSCLALSTSASASQSSAAVKQVNDIRNRIIAVSTELLTQSMRCPVPPIIVDWEDDGGFSIKDFIVKNYTGNKTEFGVRGTNELHYYIDNIFLACLDRIIFV